MTDNRYGRYLFYLLTCVGIGLLFMSEPFLRYPYDVYAHLIAIDELYHHQPVSVEIHTARLFWHELWANIFRFFHIGSVDFFLRAKIIHVVQLLIAFFSVYYFSHVVFRNLFQKISTLSLQYLSLWSVIIWLTVYATFSIKYQLVWSLWYSVNYQITLPFFWYITALSLVLLLEKNTVYKKIFFISQIVLISLFILRVHAMEFLYYLMYMGLFFLLYFRQIVGLLKKYFYIVLPLLGMTIYYFKTFFKDEFFFEKYKDQVSESLYHTVMHFGEMAVTHYNRSGYTINELMIGILGVSVLGLSKVLWDIKSKQSTINLRLLLGVLLTSSFVFIPLYVPLAGFFSLITKVNIIHRFYFASSLFLLLPIFVYYFLQRYRLKVLFINITLVLMLVSTYYYSKHTKHKIYYKNVESVLNSFKGVYDFHLHYKDIDYIGRKIRKFERLNPTKREEMYFARTDIAFVIKYIYHRRKVYWMGRKEVIPYRQKYEEHLQYERYQNILFKSTWKFPPFHMYW